MYALKTLDVSAYSPTLDSGFGYTSDDGRIKPEVMGPTNFEVASTGAVDAFSNFYGTSGSAPAVAGAAALLRAQIEENVGLTEPGYTYASLIMHGRGTTTIEPSTGGAGAVRLDPECTRYDYTKVTLDATDDMAWIEMVVDETYEEGFEAAIWWPQDAGAGHNDIDLVVYQDDPNDPNSIIPMTSSVLANSVFETVSTPVFLAEGTYYLFVEAYDIVSGPQEVYVATKQGGCSFATELQP